MFKFSIKYLNVRSYLLYTERKINLPPVYSPVINNIFNYLHIGNSFTKKQDIETPNGKRKRDDASSESPSKE